MSKTIEIPNIKLPIYVKLVVAIAIIVVVIIIVLKIIKKFKGNNDNYTREVASQINKNDLTFHESDYMQLASRLFSIMNGVGTGGSSGETECVNIIKRMKTKSDWYKLVEAFGVRKSTSLGTGIAGSTVGFLATVSTFGLVKDFEGNLNEWLLDELPDDKIKQISAHLKSINVAF